MHLIDTPTAAPGNQFTDGNAGLGQPSTKLNAKWFNAIQNELANFITARGIVLDDEDQTQLTQAIEGAIQDTSSIPIAIANNTTVWTDIAGLLLDKTKYKSAEVIMDVYRKTATLEYSTIVTVKFVYFPIADQWKMIPFLEESTGELSGIDLQIVAATGQAQYKSSNMAGGSYDGYVRYKLSRINLA